MKKLLLILIFIIISSCSSTKNTTELIADEKFELCSNIKYNRLITELGPKEGKLIYKQNIHNLFENVLLQKNYLSEISKNGYSELLNKVKRKELNSDFFKEFETELGFDPYLLFISNSHLSCYGYLFEQLKVLDEDSWQYEFGDAYNKFEAYGDLSSDNNYINVALNKIPDEKFQNIIYRKLFLDLIYMQLN